MLELALYNNENLISIKDTKNESCFNSEVFYNILSRIYNNTSFKSIIIKYSRPNFANKYILDILTNYNIYIDIYNDYNQISDFLTFFDHNKFELLTKVWSYFQHTSIYFIEEDIKEKEISNYEWVYITKKYKSYVIYKDIEENVIWIGKSKNLKFDSIDNIISDL